MMIPNNKGLLSARLGQNVYSQFAYAAPITVPCAIVHLKQKIAKTSVRVDQSASRGNTEEDTIVANILFPKTVVIREDDKFQIAGLTMRAVNVEQRFNVLGQLDHFEVALEILT